MARAAVVLAVLLFAVVVFRTAWLCDDAYITFRTVDNALHGYGLTWNPSERVQTYTHPLWMLLLVGAAAPTGEIALSSLVLSIAASVLAVAILAFLVARSWAAGVVGVALLVSSRAFVDYSTSGLANPLTHLLLAGFFALYFRRRSDPAGVPLAALAGLCACVRLDSTLLLLPPLLWALRGLPPRRALGALALGFAPLALWELFSLFYYGFPFPNTAYAKLGTGIPAAELAAQGLAYLRNALATDPVTVLGILAGLALPGVTRRGRDAAVAAGIGLQLLYLVRIGGDFMAGRLLAAPLFCAVCLTLATWKVRSPNRVALAGAAAAAVLAGVWDGAPLRSGARFGLDRPVFGSRDEDPTSPIVGGSGITDERAFYYPHTGLLRDRRMESLSMRWEDRGRAAREAGPKVVVRSNVGLYGFYAGPRVHVVDRLGVADPLLARLPVAPGRWRIGHFPRELPPGYLETLESGHNQIADSALADYYDALVRVTRGPLLYPGRWRDLLRVNATRPEPPRG